MSYNDDDDDVENNEGNGDADAITVIKQMKIARAS